MENKEIKKRLLKLSKGELIDRLIFAYKTISKLENKEVKND